MDITFHLDLIGNLCSLLHGSNIVKHSKLNSMVENQRNSVMRFRGNVGVCWEILEFDLRGNFCLFGKFSHI